MNLHKHRKEFRELVTITSQKLGIEEIYIEKDYFVILALKGLSKSAYRNTGIFKGGTSLSKAYRIINRFSEDIDIAILNEEGTGRGNRKRMEKVEQALTTKD